MFHKIRETQKQRETSVENVKNPWKTVGFFDKKTP